RASLPAGSLLFLGCALVLLRGRAAQRPLLPVVDQKALHHAGLVHPDLVGLDAASAMLELGAGHTAPSDDEHIGAQAFEYVSALQVDLLRLEPEAERDQASLLARQQ